MNNTISSVLFVVLLALVSLAQDINSKPDSITLNLILSDGFLPDEVINIFVVNNNGFEKLIFSEGLTRINHEDINVFEINLEKGKYNLVRVKSVWRDKEVSHGFMFSEDIYIDLSVNPRNEFLFILSDSLGGYD